MNDEIALPGRDPGPRVPCARCGTLRRTFIERRGQALVLECAACRFDLGTTDEQVLIEQRRRHQALLAAMNTNRRRVVEPRVTYWRGMAWVDGVVRVDGVCTNCRTKARLWSLWGEYICGSCYVQEELQIARSLPTGQGTARGMRGRHK